MKWAKTTAGCSKPRLNVWIKPSVEMKLNSRGHTAVTYWALRCRVEQNLCFHFGSSLEILSHDIVIGCSPSPYHPSDFFLLSPLHLLLLHPLFLFLKPSPPFPSSLHITHIYSLTAPSLTSVFSNPLTSSLPHLLSSPPPLPPGHKEVIQPPVPESYLNFSYGSQPTAEPSQSPRDPLTLNSMQRKCKIYCRTYLKRQIEVERVDGCGYSKKVCGIP